MSPIHAHTLIHIVYCIYTSQCSYEDRVSTFADTYPLFAHTYPQLFQAVCKPRFNYDRFCDIIERCCRAHEHEINNKKKRKRDQIEALDMVDIDIDKECAHMFRDQNYALKNDYLL